MNYKLLKEAREKKGLTLDQVAGLLNVARQTVHKYENGIVKNIPIDTIKKLADIYSIDFVKIIDSDENDNKISFSDKLCELRIQEGLTQEQLSAALGLSRSAISMYESGEREPNFLVLRKIADFFGTSTEYLLEEDDDEGIQHSIQTKEAVVSRVVFSERLAFKLRETGMKQNELAKLINVSESTVGKWILRKSMPRVEVLLKLAEIFGVENEYFLGHSMTTLKEYGAKTSHEVDIINAYRKASDRDKKIIDMILRLEK